MTEIFTGNFTQQEPILDEAIDAAVAVMRHGRLHRYNEAADGVAQTVLLEQEFAAQMGARYCLAVASGGYALATALRALGVKPGDRVLTNAFTLAPVPGAIASVGAVPVFVGVTEGLVIDLEDLAAKAHQADILMLSHMRGHIVDMDALMALAQAHNLKVIEDCAHTMGAKWGDTWSGRAGIIGCYSCQTYKHVNSGEGGLLICDDDEIMARAIMLSGSYMLYGKHRAGPPSEAYEAVRLVTPISPGGWTIYARRFCDHSCASLRRNVPLGMIAIAWWTRGLLRLRASRGSSGRSKKHLLLPPINSYCSIGQQRRSDLYWPAVWPVGWS